MHHVFFIYVECLSVSQGKDGGWSCGSSKSRFPGSERKREGQKRGRRAVETVQEVQCLLWKEGEGWGEEGEGLESLGGGRGSLFDLRSRGLI